MSRHLREKIDRAILTDPDLDAFIQSQFQDVYRRLARGMDRVQKINFLLDLHSESEVASALEDWFMHYPHSNNPEQALQKPVKCNRKINKIISATSIGLCAIFLIGAFIFSKRVSISSYAIGESDALFNDATIITRKNKSSSTDTLNSEPLGGAIYDINGNPVQGAMVILVGTDCSDTSGNNGAFDFNKCSKSITSILKRPRINIYRIGKNPIQNIELYSPPARTVINIAEDRILRSEALKYCNLSTGEGC